MATPTPGAVADGAVVVAENASPGFTADADTSYWPGMDASGPKYMQSHLWHFADLYGWFVAYCGINQSARPGEVHTSKRGACYVCAKCPAARRRERTPCD